MSKPRIRKFRNVWKCFLPGVMGSHPCGTGMTPWHAYQDWWYRSRTVWGRAQG